MRVQQHWSFAQKYCKKQLPIRWRSYLKAWLEVAALRTETAAAWETTFLSPTMRSFKAEGIVDLFVLKADNDLILARIRSSRSARAKSFFPIHVPQWFPLDFVSPSTTKQWLKWWTCLHKIRQRLPHEEGSLHLLAIHRLITPVKWTVNPAPESRPNNGGKDCILCGDVLEDTAHLFVHGGSRAPSGPS